MGLFGNHDRVDLDAARRMEPRYHYLNRTTRPSFCRIRNLLEQWYAQYPEFDEPQWLRRFRSKDDLDHLGAFFELYTRAVLGAQGYSVEREPPSEQDLQTRVEFVVRRGHDPKFLIECALVAGQGEGSPDERRLNQVLDVLDDFELPGFFLDVDLVRSAKTNPSVADIAHDKYWSRKPA